MILIVVSIIVIAALACLTKYSRDYIRLSKFGWLVARIRCVKVCFVSEKFLLQEIVRILETTK